MSSLVLLPHWGPAVSLGRLSHQLLGFMTKDFPPVVFSLRYHLPLTAKVAVVCACCPADNSLSDPKGFWDEIFSYILLCSFVFEAVISCFLIVGISITICFLRLKLEVAFGSKHPCLGSLGITASWTFFPPQIQRYSYSTEVFVFHNCMLR